MDETDVLRVLRVWAAIAWADGTLAAAEADGLRRVIAGDGLTEAERPAALALLEAPVALPAELTGLPEQARTGIYRAACRMAISDHVFTQRERRMLDQVRDLLELTPALAAELEREVPGLP
jgi:tellurite resistance protein